MNQFEQVIPGFRFAETYHGDTLQRVAARELGDAAKWVDLASLNELVPPYFGEITDPAKPGILRYGDMIMVPAAAGISGSETNPELVFRIDVALVDGEIRAENGDFVLAGGRDNLRQALVHRIRTDEGDLVFHPEYCCLVHKLKGAVNGPAAGLLGAEYVRSALLNDDRILDVSQVFVQMVGDELAVAAEVVPISGHSVIVEA